MNTILSPTAKPKESLLHIAFDLPGRFPIARWAPIPLRLIVGFGFMEHGFAKLSKGPDTFAAILHALAVPAPHFVVWITILTELLGGLAILLGAFVALVSLPMAALLLVAIFTVHLPYGFSSIKLIAVGATGAQFGPPGYECDFLYLACLAALVLGGSGPWAIDGFLTKNKRTLKHKQILWLKTLIWGFIAGVLAGLAMLLTMALLRLFLGWPTPTELIFDRVFPLLTVDFFIGSLVRAGGYTPLKLQGVFGALTAQVILAGLGGVIYALYLERRERRGGLRQGGNSLLDARGLSLIIPGVLVTTVLFVALLWPTLLTNYRGFPPGPAHAIASLEMLISFSVCGLGIMFFYGLLNRSPRRGTVDEPATGAARLVDRRRFVALGIGAAVALVLGSTLRRLFRIGTFSYDGRQYGGPKVQKITPIRSDDEFYQVSKNLVDPDVARDSWRLDIVGRVENPRVYSFADIAAMPAVEQETTLICISYGVGSGLCSNAIWKGVPLPTLLAQVKPKPNVTTVLFRAADGYYETFRFEKAMEPTTLVAYEMNGEPLPRRHGFPLRLIVPGLYGEKNPKWLTRIELLDEADGRLHRRHGCGFYKEQGWGREGDAIPTHSRIDAPQVRGDHFESPFQVGKPVELRGMAFGGDRGISKVEISTNDGHTWNTAEITKAGTKLSWSLWSFQWTPDAEAKTKIVVRATDGNGKLQISEYRDQVPDGATGLHAVRAIVEKA